MASQFWKLIWIFENLCLFCKIETKIQNSSHNFLNHRSIFENRDETRTFHHNVENLFEFFKIGIKNRESSFDKYTYSHSTRDWVHESYKYAWWCAIDVFFLRGASNSSQSILEDQTSSAPRGLAITGALLRYKHQTLWRCWIHAWEITLLAVPSDSVQTRPPWA